MFSEKATTEISNNKLEINNFLIMFFMGFGFSFDSLRSFIVLNHLNSKKDASLELVVFELVFFLIIAVVSIILSKIKIASKLSYFRKEMFFYLFATLFICFDVEINIYIDILTNFDYFNKGVQYIFLEYLMQKVYTFDSIKMLSLFTHFFYLSMRVVDFKEYPLVIVSLFFNYFCWFILIFKNSKKVDHEVYSEFKSGMLKQRFTKTKSKISKKSGSSSKEILEKPNSNEENFLPKAYFDILLNKSNDCCIIFDENNCIKYENKKAKLFFSEENKNFQFFKKDKSQTLNFMENSELEKNTHYNQAQSIVFNNKISITQHLINLREIKSKMINLEVEPNSNYKIIYNKWITLKEKIEVEININDSKSSSLDSKKLFSNSPGLKVVKKIKKYHFLSKKTFILKLFLASQKNDDYIICFFHDISAEKSMANLMMINENKSKTISFVSHEIRTPLNCIMTMLKLMEDKIDEDSYYKIIKPAENSASFLLNLVNDLLDMAQIEAGKFKVNNIEFDLKVLLSDVFTLIKLQAESRKIDLQLIYDSKLPETIKSDPNRIKQIVINLLGNALKFTTKGIIKIRAKLLKNQRFIKISVQDTGIGIKEEDKKKLFQAFGRLDLGENEKLNIQGVGLGLLISNSLSKNLGPQDNLEYQGLQVKSNYGEGTKFYFIIEDKNEENYRMMDFNEEEKMPIENIHELSKNNETKFKHLPSLATKYKEGEIATQSFKKRNKAKNSTENNLSPTHKQNEIFALASKMSKSDVLSESKKLLTIQKNFDENFMKEVFLNKNLMKRNQLITEFFCTNHMNSKLTMDFKEVEDVMNMIVKRNKAKICECFDILICDDNDFNILPLTYLLEGLHFKVDSCFSGQEAIVKVQNNYEENKCCPFYGIIFMDIEMPVKNGKKATKEILEYLADKKEKKQIIIGCTGYSFEKEKDECIKSGMDSVMTKPITKGVLMKNIAKYFQIEQYSSIVLKEDVEICIRKNT